MGGAARARRGLAAALCAAAAGLSACAGAPEGEPWVTAPGPGVVAARFEGRTDLYPHRIMGDIREAVVLAVRDGAGRESRVDLRAAPGGPRVFEDIAPRVVDADGDGRNDVVVVEADLARGAQLAVYSLRQDRLAKVAATPEIGTRFRWLAPVAVADLDGDGITDIAYVETPHLAKRLRVWTWAPGGLTARAALDGLTNHRIGDETIAGGLRDCGAGPEMILADADWRRIVAVTFSGDGLAARPLDLAPDPIGFDAALACSTG